ncbi:protein of unknown function [Streptosporangium subroseum]|uniref:DUF397 domain-containing protein n=1 Tax=Streptosporangium subroseum TaxID=106412 RepID=A0A239MXT6_9ACTN|nr:DUF397 domain-containing protein [Streptosporangium subroseum]SNT46992.1 protein of unknown function [Streptosporangium subroseum]
MKRPTFQGAVWKTIPCNGGQCPQIAYQDGYVGVRNSEDGDDGPLVVFSADEWDGFVVGISGFTSDKLES